MPSLLPNLRPLVLGVGLLSIACGDGGRAAADAASRAAESAFESIKSEARTYAPEQVEALETAFATMKARYDQGDYGRALADATGLAPRITALQQQALERKAELTKAWQALAELPTLTATLEARVKALSTSRRLPANVTKETVARAQQTLTTIRADWDEASRAFTEGQLPRAVARAQEVKAKLVDAMTSLGLPVPDALK